MCKRERKFYERRRSTREKKWEGNSVVRRGEEEEI